MKVIAVIAEYNPFHSGHAYHIAKIREAFGTDSAVIAIMSGNYVQRGDVAIADKWIRAKAAVRCGCDLVLELPFPYSMMSAERFGEAGVSIANALGCVDALSFGSECGDLPLLERACRILSDTGFHRQVSEKVAAEENLGYPAARALALREKDEALADLICAPNNSLALSYLLALQNSKSRILPHTVKRVGTAFSSLEITDSRYPSASALRTLAEKGESNYLCHLPENCRDLYADSYHNSNFPCKIEKLSGAILSFFRLSPSDPSDDFCDASGGLYTRLRNASFEAADFSAFLSLVKAKHLTDAHLRRAILSSFFGVTSSDVKEAPAYTQMLAAGKRGTALLRIIAETGRIPVLTKPSATGGLSETAKRQKQRADRADSVFELTKPNGGNGTASLRATPYIG